MTNTELIKVLRCELYGDDECDKSDCPIWSELGCRNGIANRAAADAIERLVAEVEQWKQAWATTQNLVGHVHYGNVPPPDYKALILADRLETCAGSICSSDAPECPYREYGAFECQQKLMCDAANALRGKEIEDGVHTADMD